MTAGIIAYLAVGVLVGYVRARLEVRDYEQKGLWLWEFDRMAITVGFLLTVPFWPLVCVFAALSALLTRSP